MARRRKKRQPREVEFDLTPMIDVTFQLLIFFIVAMKFKQPERRQGSNLSLTSGPAPTPAEKTKLITIRLNWEPTAGTMEYQVCRGDAKTSEIGPIEGGSLSDLLNDRFNEGYPHYKRVYDTLGDHLASVYEREPEAVKMEIALTNDSQKSAMLQIDELPPWGFITLALDACTGFNKRLVANPPATLPDKFRETGLEIVTKNSTPSDAFSRSQN